MIRQVKITVPAEGVNLEVTVTFKRIRNTEFWDAYIGITPMGVYHTDFVNFRLASELVGRL